MSGGDVPPRGRAKWRWPTPGRIIREILAHRGTIETPLYGADTENLAIIRETRRRVPLLLNDAAALQIILCARAAARTGAAMAEAGVLMGGSARLICEAKGPLALHLFDVFETLQPGQGDTASAIELRQHFKTTHGQLGSVQQLLAGYSAVQFHPGVFPATTAGLEDKRFGFVHLDLDLESSTSAGLDYFHPRLVPGGILIGDDYDDPAIRALFARFFADRPDTLIELPWGQVMVVRVPS